MVSRSSDNAIAVVVYDGIQSLDLTGPVEVFHTASLLLGGTTSYSIRTVGPEPTVTTSSGLRLQVDSLLSDDTEPVDTLVVAGGLGARRAAADERLVDEVSAMAGRARRVASVCTGAFVLGAAGLLDDRRAVTHWAECADLAAMHPRVEVDPDAIYVRDGDVWTSAGVTAGMDLALALVADDHDSDLARSVAGWLVMFTHRGGGQSQFSPLLEPTDGSGALRDLRDWMLDHLHDDLGVARLAERCGMSPRHFARVFREEVGTTPGAYVESLRIDAARRLLQTTDLTVAAVARRVGFRSDAVLHRAFTRTVHTTPGTYRTHFTTRS